MRGTFLRTPGRFLVFLISIQMLSLNSMALTRSGAFTRPSQPGFSHGPTADQIYGGLPLVFVPNEGQFPPQVLFASRGRGMNLFLTASEAVLVFPKDSSSFPRRRPRPGASLPSSRTKPDTPKPPDVLRLGFSGASGNGTYEPLEKLPGKSNYFIGKDSSQWHRGVPEYGKVQRDLYPGIDMVYYGDKGHLEYDLRVAPGADPGVIRMRVSGADSEEIAPDGSLSLAVGGRKVAFRAPEIYQEKDGGKVPVEGRFNSKDGEIGFEVKPYDKTIPLVIDPVLDYSTYLGGTGDDQGEAIAVDGSGDAYVAGGSEFGGFPLDNPYQGVNGGNYDAFVTELNPAGTAEVYSTYLGGSGYDFGYGIAVDNAGDAVVTGQSDSSDFPVTPGVYQSTLKGAGNVFVTKLNADGSALLYSTYLGGSSSDSGSGVALDSTGNAYVGGITSSSNFPTSAGAYQASNQGGDDGFVAKLNPTGTSLLYSTFLGGKNYDYLAGVAVDSGGNACVAGWTTSSDFPTTAGAYQTAFTESNIAFVAKVNPTGTGLVYSTYLGGTFLEEARGIAVDSGGNAYVTGQCQSTDFPTTTGAYQTTFGGTVDAFVTKLNPAGTSLVYSTYVGGSGYVFSGGIAVDSNGDAFVTGTEEFGGFPTTSDAYQNYFAGGIDDSFLFELNSAGSGLAYSTYFGGTNEDLGLGVAVDTLGDIYLVGEVYSTDFPVTSGAFQTTYGGGGNFDAFVAKFDAVPLNTPTVTPTATVTFTPTLTRTPTFTGTVTPTSSQTSTQTFTSTFTATQTKTATSTPTASWTPSATRTPTVTPTLTFTRTPTASSTPTFTRTVTWSPTPSKTPTETRTPTETKTPTATASPSPTPFPCGYPGDTCTPTATFSGGPDIFYVSKNLCRPSEGPVSIFISSSEGPGNYDLSVFNTAGEAITQLGAGYVSAPFQKSFLWYGKNKFGESCASGVYIFYLTEPFAASYKKILLVR